MIPLAILFGLIVGFALGLTGGGGGVFAVPLLVYGLGVAPREAVGISLAAVGGTALSGVIPRLRRGDVEIRTGIFFAISGMVGAPLGTVLASLIPESLLLVLFAFLMLVVAWRMWRKSQNPGLASGVSSDEGEEKRDLSACQRNEDGTLRLTSRCARLLIGVGLGTGILSGMFGVGGGFVIVPALVLFSGMQIHRAVGTSLFVIVLISASGVVSHMVRGNSVSLETAGYFMVGGIAGMFLGGLVAGRLKGPVLQKVFAWAIVFVAVFTLVKSLMF